MAICEGDLEATAIDSAACPLFLESLVGGGLVDTTSMACALPGDTRR